MDHQQNINQPPQIKRSALFYFFFALFALVLIGFLGYYLGFLGFIYNVMMPGAFGKFPLIILAIIFGTAAFFSPCSFSVLPAYVSHYLAGDTQEKRGALGKGIYFGFIAALGVITVNLLVGLVIALLGSTAPFAKDPREDIALILGIRTVAGLLIAAMGILTVLDRPLPVPSFFHRFIGRASFGKSIFFYGLLYNGAALGCTGPILLGLMLYALSTGSFTSAFTAFAVFALTMGTLMVLLTTAIAISKEKAIQKLIPLTPTIKKLAGWVMILVGFAIALLTLERNHIFVKIFFPFLK